MSARRTALIAGLLVSLAATDAAAQKFFPDDPMLVDDDELDVPEKPEEIELSDMYDRFGHMFHDWGESPIGTEAVNVNTLDEVPDGSWFVNRHGVDRMTLEELARGPNQGQGPDPSETWTVFQSKSQGVTPGFQIYDEQGDRYIIKLDPVERPEIASTAEVIVGKIFYALGYHTPENYIVRVLPEKLVIEEGTEVEDTYGDKMPLTQWRLNRSIRLVPRLEDGTIRVTASKYLDGIPLGPFRYYGTRSDDPNDVLPHEDRRELRGLRLIAAWLNHDDTRAQNTQDAWAEENGRHFVRHYMLDFGSTLGSGSIDMQYPYLTFTYTLDFREWRRNLFGLGLRVPEYRRAEWPDFPDYQAVGRIESELFDCEAWRNDYPNPAFVRMTSRDAFWAAKIIMSLTREELEAIIATGEYTRIEDAELLARKCWSSASKSAACFGINAHQPARRVLPVRRLPELRESSRRSTASSASETSYEAVSWSSLRQPHRTSAARWERRRSSRRRRVRSSRGRTERLPRRRDPLEPRGPSPLVAAGLGVYLRPKAARPGTRLSGSTARARRARRTP